MCRLSTSSMANYELCIINYELKKYVKANRKNTGVD